MITGGDRLVGRVKSRQKCHGLHSRRRRTSEGGRTFVQEGTEGPVVSQKKSSVTDENRSKEK